MSARVAVIGFDHMHAGDQISVAQQLPQVDLVSVWDDESKRMAEVCGELGIDPDLRYDDLDALVEKTAPDVAVVCSTTDDHRRLAEYFAARGIHVLLEKPFASSLPDAAAMMVAARAGSVLLGVNWPLAWFPVHRTAHRLVEEGRIGRVLEVHYYDGNRGPLFHTHGKRELTPNQISTVKSTAWWYSAAAGGGSLRDYLGYGVTLGTWLRSGELPDTVTARTHVVPGDEVDEQSVVIASYGSGLSTFQTRWGTFTDPWTHQPNPRCGFVLVGAAGTIASHDYANHVVLQDDDHPGGIRVPVDSFPVSSGLADLVRSMSLGEPLTGPLSAELSFAGQRIVEAAADSARMDRTVPLGAYT